MCQCLTERDFDARGTLVTSAYLSSFAAGPR